MPVWKLILATRRSKKKKKKKNVLYLTQAIRTSTYKFESHFFRTGRRIAPKFCTHVRIDTLTLIFCLTHPTPGGLSEPNPDVAMCVAAWRRGCVGYSLTYFGTRPSDRAQIWHACADRHSHLKQTKQFDPPHPRGV